MKYRAICSRCYSCYLTADPKGVTKKQAEVEAVSHMNAYGHATSIQPVEKTAKK